MRIFFVTESARVFVNHAGLQGSQSGKWLYRRAEWKVFLKGDLRIDYGPDAAGLRIHHDNGAATIAERERGCALQALIE
jgi:hypothetical protein